MQKIELDRDITLNEIHEAAKSMHKSKAPGLDGLTLEFYLNFFDKLGPILMELYTKCIKCGILNRSARHGLITLIPKKGKNPKIIKNLRPLTLLNIEYKILARTMALRMKGIINDIIGDHQTGFLEGRQLQSNLCCTIDILTHVNKTGK